ncbi:MAG: sigma-70 family RNA polymerase sigma factor [Planctomycetales bacterium]|nr:sigma-70 family RNA polymerase sigma factor [Planctomycetales bacterium]
METRTSLISQLKDPTAQTAWGEFVEAYRPLIVRVARAKGLQNADSEDLAQDVLTIVGRSIAHFVPGSPGSFRRWLRTVTRNLVVNHLTRSKGPVGSGDSAVQQMLLQIPVDDDPTGTLFDLELKRSRFQSASAIVRAEFSESTWLAFWQTAVEQLSIQTVAERMGKKQGAIRMARYRVVHRLREVAASLEDE